MKSLRLLSVWGEVGTSEHDDSQNDTEETQSGSENFDDEQLDEQGGVGSVRQGSAGTSDTDRDTEGETTCNKKEEGKKVSQKKEWPIVRWVGR